MVPTITLCADTAATGFETLMSDVRQVCDAVFDGPYHFEVHDFASSPEHQTQLGKGPVLTARAGHIARRVADCGDQETLILRLHDFKRALAFNSAGGAERDTKKKGEPRLPFENA